MKIIYIAFYLLFIALFSLGFYIFYKFFLGIPFEVVELMSLMTAFVFILFVELMMISVIIEGYFKCRGGIE